MLGTLRPRDEGLASGAGRRARPPRRRCRCSSTAKQDVSIPMDDGVSIAATLYLPDGAPPAGGWPAIVFLHGLSGTRQQMNTLVESYGFTDGSYAILTFDARGHGASGGLVGIDGPREVADTRAVRDWLAARPDVSDTKIGAWGISYGGGAMFNSLVAGVPWAAVPTVQTWTNLYAALMPQGLVKSGLVAGLSSSIPEARRDPSPGGPHRRRFYRRHECRQAVDGRAIESLQAVVGHDPGLHGPGSARLPLRDRPGHGGIRAPEGAEGAVRRPARSRAVDVPGGGHRFPPVPGARLVRLLPAKHRLRRGAGVGLRGVREVRRSGRPAWSACRRRVADDCLVSGRDDVRPQRKSRPHLGAAAYAARDLGAPSVQTSVAASGGWSRLVAVLTARTPQGKEITIADGGVPTRPGAQKLTIRLGARRPSSRGAHG